MAEPLKIDYDHAQDVITIEGVKYSADLFRQLGGILPAGAVFQFNGLVNGTVCLTRIPPGTVFVNDQRFE